MNAAILRRGVAEGWRGLLVAAVAVGAMLALALAMYRDLDLSIYEALPGSVRAVMGIPAQASPALMAYNEMLAVLGALTFTGVSIALGARTVTADETSGRLSLILAAPISRTALGIGRAAAFVVTVVAAGVVLWGCAEIAPALLGVEVGDAHVSALMVHFVANALFHGALAFAIASGLGRRSAGAAGAATVMVGGWLATGLLPLWREGAADWVPWNWFNGSKPLVNGIDVGQVVALTAGALVLLSIGVVGFARREIRPQGAQAGVTARLRCLPVVARLLRPSGRGHSLLGLRLASQQVLLSYLAALLALVMGLGMPPLYGSLVGALGDFAHSVPRSMTDLFGGGDLATPAGFLHLETFGLVAPLCVVLVVTAGASSGISGEERAGRLGLLLAQPIGRPRVYVTVAAAVGLASAILAASLVVGTWAGIALAGVAVEWSHLAWSCILLMMLGWFFGACALALSAGTGRPGIAVWGTTGLAVVSYFGYTLLLAAGHENLGLGSPFAAYLHGPVLAEGVRWWQPVWLGVATLICLAAGLAFWVRRDLRSATA